MEIVLEYLEETIAPFIKTLYDESTPAMKVGDTSRVKEVSGTVEIWEALVKRMSTFTPREVIL